MSDRIVILGAGLSGVTTAYYLARAGARVTVVDRRLGPGLETSLANGGHLSGGHARPWATPAAPGQLARWLGRKSAPLRLPLRWDPALLRWGLRYLGNCTPARYHANTRTLLRLARYSADVTRALAAQSGIEFDYRPAGLLTVYRSAYSFDHGAAESAALVASGDATEQPLSAAECARIEPALGPAVAAGLLAGAVFTPDGASGDAHRFTLELEQRCASLGVEFRYGAVARGIESRAGRVTGVATSTGALAASTVVVALANGSVPVAAAAGVRLPIYPVKGYSVSVTPPHADQLPRIGILDEDRKVVMTPVSGWLRAAGTAEFAGNDETIDLDRVRPILAACRELLPAATPATTPEDARPWTGLRPMTPDGPPILGPVRGCAGLFLNTGHGPLGWTLAAGSAAMLADWIGGRPPAIATDGLTIERFQ